MEATKNASTQARHLGDRSWRSIAFERASASRRLLHMQHPFRTLSARAKSGELIDGSRNAASTEQG